MLRHNETNSSLLLWLAWSSFFLFFGRAYQYYFFGAPYTALLWDESLLSPLIESLGYSWYNYSTSTITSKYISLSINLSALFFLFSSLLSFSFSRIYFLQQFKRVLLSVSLTLLVFLGICLVKDKNYDLLQFFELSSQFVVPIVLLMYYKNQELKRKSITLILRVAIALTFIPHGLFAMGIPYIPGNFIDMCIKILGISENQSTSLLFIVGILDITFSIMLFFPKTVEGALLYCTIWGMSTAIARLVFGIQANFFWSSLHNTLADFIFRIPNGLIPLTVLFSMSAKYFNKKLKKITNEK